MEKKIKVMEIAMAVLLVGSVLSSLIIKGAFWLAGVLAVGVAAFALALRKSGPRADEREIQLSLLACYGAMCVTLSFTSIMTIKNSACAAAYGNVQTVLICSLLVFNGVLRRAWK